MTNSESDDSLLNVSTAKVIMNNKKKKKGLIAKFWREYGTNFMKEVRTSAAYSYNAWLPSGRYGLVIISIPYQGRIKKKIYKVELCSQVDPAFNVNFEGEGPTE